MKRLAAVLVVVVVGVAGLGLGVSKFWRQRPAVAFAGLTPTANSPSAPSAPSPKGSTSPSSADMQLVATLDDMALIGASLRQFFTSNSGSTGFLTEPTNFDQVYAQLVPAYAPDLPRVDRWGTPYQYVAKGSYRYRIISAGSDRRFDDRSVELPDYAEPTTKVADGADLIFDNQHGLLQHPPLPKVAMGTDKLQILTRTHAALRHGRSYIAQGWVGNGTNVDVALSAIQSWKCASGQELVNRDTESTNVSERVDHLAPGEVAFFQLVMNVTSTPRFESHLNRPPRQIDPEGCRPTGQLILTQVSASEGVMPFSQVAATQEWFVQKQDAVAANEERARVSRERMQKLVEGVAAYARIHPEAFRNGFVKGQYQGQLAEVGLTSEDFYDGWGRPLNFMASSEDEYYILSVGQDGRLDDTASVEGNSDDETRRLLSLMIHLNSSPYPSSPYQSFDQDIVVRVRNWSRGEFVQGGSPT